MSNKMIESEARLQVYLLLLTHCAHKLKEIFLINLRDR